MTARNLRLRKLRSSAMPSSAARARASTFAGTGVGLYVAPIVAEAHAGSLALESDRDGKGDHVRVKLPL
jgi:signal transduction histidine kinase